MAVDTPSRRYAALDFGAPYRAGTRIPSGSIPVFERAALLGLYYNSPAPVEVPDLSSCGWLFTSDSRVFLFESDTRVFNLEGC